MKIIIDGYNLIKSIESEFPLGINLRQKREHLIKLLASSYISHKKEILVVFDSDENDQISSNYNYKNVKIKYSYKGKKADEVIQELVRSEIKPNQLEIVTSDREIQFTAKQHSASVINAQEFWKKIRKRKNSHSHNIDRDLSKKEIREWLNIFQQRKSNSNED
jgi:predicted RNA-binding protein with PIN domain